MSGEGRAAERLALVKRKLPIAQLVEKHVKLSGSATARNRRGRCPFHGSNSASFSVKHDAEGGFGHCFGCQWHGDVVRFAQDFFGLSFLAALELCETEAGISCGATTSGCLSAEGSGTIHRERNPSPRRERARELVEAIDMGRWIWRHARSNADAVRRYFLGRGVPERALTDARIAPFRYFAECPCVAWDRNASPAGCPIAPAIMALVCRPVRELLKPDGSVIERPRTQFVPTGLHVTYLNPAGDDTMVRRKPWAKADDPDPWLPKRRMLGPVGGGAILLGVYRADAPLYVGEGNETVLSAIGLAEAADDVVGVATLSLDNLQGRPKLWKNGVWPLHAIEPDPERPPFTIPGHRGPVTGLIDSDMNPLRGPLVRPNASLHEAGAAREGEPASSIRQAIGARVYAGECVVERKGGPIVRRAITGAERARICGELVVKGWRAAGVADVRAVRAPSGMDFNDAARARASEVI